MKPLIEICLGDEDDYWFFEYDPSKGPIRRYHLEITEEELTELRELKLKHERLQELLKAIDLRNKK